jgi:hypothetical protein
MFSRPLFIRTARVKKALVVGAMGILLTTSCASVAPILTAAATKFAQDLLAAATHNVSPGYSQELELLLLALLEETTDIRIPSSQDTPEYAAYSEPGEYRDQSTEEYSYTSDYDPEAYSESRGIEQAISMDVGLHAQRMRPGGEIFLEAIEDGATLFDGRGNPEAGDKLKVSFRPNCDCFVYVIGIDATGFVAQIFPDPDSSIGNPVEAGKEYMFPQGDMWWGLDDFRGVETVYFFASYTRRTDIEQLVENLASTERRVPEDYRAVEIPPVIPPTRGMVKVSAASPTELTTMGGVQQEVTPTAFTAQLAGVDLVVTRWFHHQ